MLPLASHGQWEKAQPSVTAFFLLVNTSLLALSLGPMVTHIEALARVEERSSLPGPTLPLCTSLESQ